MSQLRRVLVVDDEPAIRQVMIAALVDEGYHVDEAADGVDALELAMENVYDVILLDLQMPRMDGWTFLQRYSSLDGRHARIAICSAKADVDTRVTRSAAVAFLRKPFAIDDLLACVEWCAQTPQPAC
jgi:DNA-binding response OmpR family regulator